MFYVLLRVTLCPFLFSDREERTGCFVCLPGVSLFLTMPRVCLQFVIVVFPDHTHYILGQQKILNKSITKLHWFYIFMRMNAIKYCINKIILYVQFTIKCNDFGRVIPNTAANVSIFEGSLIKFIDSVFS